MEWTTNEKTESSFYNLNTTKDNALWESKDSLFLAFEIEDDKLFGFWIKKSLVRTSQYTNNLKISIPKKFNDMKVLRLDFKNYKVLASRTVPIKDFVVMFDFK